MKFPARIGQLALAFLLVASCQDDQISHTRIVTVTEPAPAHPPMPTLAPAPPASPAAPPGMAGDVPPPPRPTGAGQLTWTLPQGWTQTLTGGVRYATLKAPLAGDLEISVVVLAGTAGGELANVNRWRSQIGLSALSEEDLGSVRKTLRTKLGPISLYDLTGEGKVKTRLVVAIAQSDDNSWFFKLTGEATLVGKALPDFTSLVASLRTGNP